MSELPADDRPPSPVHEPAKSLFGRLLQPKVAIPALLFLLVLLAPVLIRGWHLRGVPDFAAPANPAGEAGVNVPADENAFVEYRQATAVSTRLPYETEETFERTLEQGWSAADDDLRRWLEHNRTALELWLQGTAKPDAQYLTPDEYSYSVTLPVIQELRDLHRVALLEAERLTAEGHPEDAWKFYQASLRASRHAGRHGCLIERLNGAAAFQATADEIADWATDPRLTAEQLHNAADDLQAAWELTAPLSETMWLESKVAESLFDDAAANSADETGSSPGVGSSLLWIRGEPSLSRRLARYYFRNQIPFVDRPLFERPPIVGRAGLFEDSAALTQDGQQFGVDAFETAVQRSVLARAHLPSFSTIYRVFDREAAQYHNLLVLLAAQAHHRTHDRFPLRVEELVPQWIPEVPVDVYDGRPVKYRLDPQGAVVYSVFENLSDDGGVEIDFDHIAGTGRQDPDDLGLLIRTPSFPPVAAPRP